jgi:Glycosyl transferase family 2
MVGQTVTDEPRARPLVGLIIATYNRANFVARAIESALRQTYPNLQVVVVDDGSTDATPTVLESYAQNERIRLLRHEQNRGATASRNTGISGLGEVRLFALLDSDDVLLRDAVDTLVRVFETSGDRYSLAVGWAQDIHTHEPTGKEIRPGYREGTITFDDALAGRFAGDFWVLARRDLLGEIRFEERARGGEGAVWLRLLRQRPGWLVPNLLLEKDRTSADRLSSTDDTRASAGGMMWVQKAMLDAGGEDLRRSYPERYGGRLAEMAKWAALAGDGRRARAASRKSLRVAPSTRAAFVALASLLPAWLLWRLVTIRNRIRRLSIVP